MFPLLGLALRGCQTSAGSQKIFSTLLATLAHRTIRQFVYQRTFHTNPRASSRARRSGSMVSRSLR